MDGVTADVKQLESNVTKLARDITAEDGEIKIQFVDFVQVTAIF